MLTLLIALAPAQASDVIGEEPHAELVVGFFAGDRSLGKAPFVQDGGDRPIAGLDEAFAGYPLHDAVVFGPRLEGRVVVPPLRASVGWQRPYPDWEVAVPDTSELDGAGVPLVSSVRALSTHEVVLGIGLEAPTGLLVPFVDVVGVVHWATVTLEVDGVRSDYHSESFSLGGRGGVRLQVSDHTFVELAGEGSPRGPRTWGVVLGLGVAAF
jgi:hypothetical protein